MRRTPGELRATHSSRKPSRKEAVHRPTVSIIGCGNWGTSLARALGESGNPPLEIIHKQIKTGARNLPAFPNSRMTTLDRARVDADVVWICTPDASIATVGAQLAEALGRSSRRKPPLVFHSSGALASSELAPLRKLGISVASVHPLMTFPPAARRRATKLHGLAGVPFAIEGDAPATRAARKLIRAMGGEPFSLPAGQKALYHAFGAFTSPLIVSLLQAGVSAGRELGYSESQARRRMRPIVEQTISNFFLHGAANSFSGPVARGDAATIARHLGALRERPSLLPVYRELTRFAAEFLPARNRATIKRLLR